MTVLERIGLEVAGGVAALAAVLLWWHLHNLGEQKLGAEACIQATTITKTQATADVATTEAAQAVDINAVVKGYDDKVASLSARNDDLAGRLSDAVRQNRVPNPGSVACPVAANPGLSESEGAAQRRLGRIRADLKSVLDACDANQVKTEDLASIYDGVRERAIAAAAVN